MSNTRNFKSLKNFGKKLVMMGGLLGLLFFVAHEAKADGDDWYKVKVLGYHTNSEGVEFQVPTGGCLKKSDFRVRRLADDRYEGLYHLLLTTNRVDQCRRFFPFGAFVKFSFEEIGVKMGDGFVVENAGGIVRRAGFADVFEVLPADGE